jgi:uncharacterized protein YcsI (UPF0317 family)
MFEKNLGAGRGCMTDTTNTDSGRNLFEELRHANMESVREAIRSGAYRGHTAGIGLGLVQGNVAILPADYALDFFRFCQRNPKPCPLVGVSDTGEPMLRTLGEDIDIRRDVPLYNIYLDGKLDRQEPDIDDLWRDDMVAFVLGCSFTFERALLAEGIRLAHIDDNKVVSMYRTSIETRPAGPFRGPVVVSMRPMRSSDAIRASVITARFPHAHGSPIHFGDPGKIGIGNLSKPDWGDTVTLEDDQVPVFWACGVTPQAAVQLAKPPLCITHAPGRMLITDIPDMLPGN